MDSKLQEINKYYVRLGDEAEKKNNALLRQVLQDFETELKKDELFKALYMKMFFGGSYYDKLKVKDPNEYDIDVLLVLPKLCKTTLLASPSAGYVEAVLNLEDIIKNATWFTFQKITKFIENNKMSISKVNRWFEGIVQQAVNNLKSSNRPYQIESVRKSGPAMTLRIKQGSNWFDVDLVPCFNFRKSSWPKGYRNTSSEEDFFIVPKPTLNKSDLLWRLSFQIQERTLLKDQWNVKPALRLLKVLRDNEVCMAQIKSYFLKTILLWEIQNEEAFRQKSLSVTFLYMLEKYYEYIKNKKIAYYWNDKLNLLTGNEKSLFNIETRLQNIIKDLKKGQPEALDKYFGKR